MDNSYKEKSENQSFENISVQKNDLNINGPAQDKFQNLNIQNIHDKNMDLSDLSIKKSHLDRTNTITGDSFAMKMVKNKLTALEEVQKRTDLPEQEKKNLVLIALYELEEVCTRYKEARYAKSGYKNERHRIVDSILNQVTNQLEKEGRKEPDVSVNYSKVRLCFKELKSINGFDELKQNLEQLDDYLAKEVSLNDNIFMKQKDSLLKRYNSVISILDDYLKDTTRLTGWTKNNYRIISDALVQFKFEYKKISNMSEKTFLKNNKEGYTWKNAINPRGIIITDADLNKQKNVIVTAKDTDAKMSAVYSALDFKKYIIYERGEKVSVGKGGRAVRRNISISTGIKDYKTKKEVFDLAKKQKLEVVYSNEVLFDLTSIQLIDMIAGVKDRKDDSLCFKYREVLQGGRKTLELYDVKVLYTKGALTKENADSYNLNKKNKTGRIFDPESEKKDRVINMSGYDPVVADRIMKLDENKFFMHLNKKGVVIDKEERNALLDRLRAVKSALKLDMEKGTRNSFFSPTTDRYHLNETQKKVERANFLACIIRDANDNLSMIKKDYVNDGYVNDNKKRIRDEELFIQKEKKDKLTDNEKFAKKLNEMANKASDSYIKMSQKKKQIAERVNEIFSKMMTKPSKGLLDIKDRFEKYTKLETTISQVEEIGLQDKYRLKYKQQNKKLLDEMIDINDMLDDYKHDIDEEEDDDFLWAYDHPVEEEKEDKPEDSDNMRFIRDERIYLIWIRNLIAEHRKNINEGIIKQNEEEKSAEISCVDELEGLLDFTKGTLEVPDGAKVINDNNITYRFNGKNLRMMDTSAIPLFEHEPCLEDIRQGGLGDCYFLATMASVVETDPSIIKDMMRDNGDTVTVRFYGQKGHPHYFNIKKSVPVSDDGKEPFAKGAYWVQYLEKAYTLMNAGTETLLQKFVFPDKTAMELFQGNTRDYFNIDAGNPWYSLSNFTGRKTSKNITSFTMLLKNPFAVTDEEISRNYSSNITKLLADIKNAKAEGKVIAATSRGINSENKGLNGEGMGQGIVGNHGYSVLGVDMIDGREMIKVRNPWGFGSMHYEAQEGTDLLITRWEDESKMGSFYITPERFVAYFKDYNIS